MKSILESQLPPAAVVVVVATLFDNHRKGGVVFDVAWLTENLSPEAEPTSSSNPSKISSSMTTPETSKLLSSSVSSFSFASIFSVAGKKLAVGETGDDDVGLVLLSSSLEAVGLLRELPAKEFR